MTETAEKDSVDTKAQATEAQATAEPASQTAGQGTARGQHRRWWLRLFLQPLIFLAGAALLFAAVAVTQQLGWLSAERPQESGSVQGSDRYICPMMCTPAQSEPGRCPVCQMELVAAPSGAGRGMSTSIEIDPVARRVADIQTAEVKRSRVTRRIRAVGELRYDEGAMKTIAAYTDGRIERLYADYTGVVVGQGDTLALVYSPRLYSGQVEYLLAKKALESNQSASLPRLVESNQQIYQSARQRLIELGMTDSQIDQLDQTGEASSRLKLMAPISGTVIEKLAVEGQYVKEGQPIYRLADLSTVWLMLRLFPDDASLIRYGQRVEATIESLPGKTFAGRVAFIDPNVDPTTRTVGVRVVIPNADGTLRVGDYARATLQVSPEPAGDDGPIYDAELADKWISPRHPHVVREEPGPCPVCGIALVPASKFGFTDDPEAGETSLTVPRDAVLMAGKNSVVYVEVEPGKFEIRRVELGASVDDMVVVLDGVKEGESVATRGNFLIDSQMQLAGNPSLIDPNKTVSKPEKVSSPEVRAALAQLSDQDRQLAERQRICPVTELPLGSMGVPPIVNIDGRKVFICCEGCRQALLRNSEKYMSNLSEHHGPADH